MRSRPGQVEPEVYFRIVHVAQVCDQGSPVAGYRELTVEIALGPKGAFENDEIGILTRRIEAVQVVSVVPPHRGNLKSPTVAKTPPVTELLRKAMEWRRQFDAGEVRNQAAIARREGITRARVTQVMRFLRLPREAQEYILAMPPSIHRSPITQRMLRPIDSATDCRGQLRVFHG